MKRSSSIKLVHIASVSAIALGLSACEEQADTQVMGDFFSTKAECLALTGEDNKPTYTAEQCDAAEVQAKAEHAKNAPHFSTREQCEAEFGAEACVPSATYGQSAPSAPVSGGGGGGGDSQFMPFMMGYMLGNMSGGGYSSTPLYYGRGGRGDDRPVYASGGSYYKGKTTSGTTSKPLGYVSRTTPSVGTTTGKPTAFKSTVVSPSVKTGGMPAPSSVSKAASSFSSRSAVSTSSRGGFGSVGRGFSSGGA